MILLTLALAAAGAALWIGLTRGRRDMARIFRREAALKTWNEWMEQDRKFH